MTDSTRPNSMSLSRALQRTQGRVNKPPDERTTRLGGSAASSMPQPQIGGAPIHIGENIIRGNQMGYPPAFTPSVQRPPLDGTQYLYDNRPIDSFDPGFGPMGSGFRGTCDCSIELVCPKSWRVGADLLISAKVKTWSNWPEFCKCPATCNFSGGVTYRPPGGDALDNMQFVTLYPAGMRYDTMGEFMPPSTKWPGNGKVRWNLKKFLEFVPEGSTLGVWVSIDCTFDDCAGTCGEDAECEIPAEEIYPDPLK